MNDTVKELALRLQSQNEERPMVARKWRLIPVGGVCNEESVDRFVGTQRFAPQELFPCQWGYRASRRACNLLL